VLGSPSNAVIRGDFDRMIQPFTRRRSVRALVPEDSGDGCIEFNGAFWQIDVKLVDQGAHAVGHLDIFFGHIFKRAVQNGWNEGQIVADVGAEVKNHGEENGLGLLANGIVQISAKFLFGQSLPNFFQVLEQRFAGQFLLHATVGAVETAGFRFSVEKELVTLLSQLSINGLPS
jgi:hypothetical protein